MHTRGPLTYTGTGSDPMAKHDMILHVRTTLFDPSLSDENVAIGLLNVATCFCSFSISAVNFFSFSPACHQQGSDIAPQSRTGSTHPVLNTNHNPRAVSHYALDLSKRATSAKSGQRKKAEDWARHVCLDFGGQGRILQACPLKGLQGVRILLKIFQHLSPGISRYEFGLRSDECQHSTYRALIVKEIGIAPLAIQMFHGLLIGPLYSLQIFRVV